MSRRNRQRLFRNAGLRVENLEDRVTPAVYTVTNLNDTGAGSLRLALATANGTVGVPDTINIAVAGPIGVTSVELPITDAVTINGLGPGVSVVTGLNARRVFNINITSPTVDVVAFNNLTIAAGKTTSGGGAGVLMADEDVTFTNCQFLNNINAVLTGDNVGGAIFATAAVSLTLNACLFQGNSSANAGGAILIDSNSQSVTIANSAFVGNSAGGGGGALHMRDGSLSIDQSLFMQNKSELGGGAILLVDDFKSCVISNSTFHENSTNGNGGAIGDTVYSGGTYLLQNCTLTGNSAVMGGGISRGGLAVFALSNTIVSGNQSASSGLDLAGNAFVLNHTAIGSGSGFTFTGTGNLPYGSDLKLRAIANNGGPTTTIAFDSGSPLLDAGQATTLTVDQRGLDRSRGTAPDIGAFERQASGVVLNTVNSGEDSLRENILEANRVAGADAITFDPAIFSSAKTIPLASELSITGAVTITGPGAQLLTISGNNASRVFNIAATTAAPVGLSCLTITGGKAVQGAGILVDDETLTLTKCYVADNTTTGTVTGQGGGGIMITNGGIVMIVDSTFDQNVSQREGGAISFGNTAGTLTLLNSTLANNTAQQGGAIYFDHDSGGGLTIRNSTITKNSATSLGGGIYRIGSVSAMKVDSTILSGNFSASAVPSDVVGGGIAQINFSAIGSNNGFTFTGANNLALGLDLKLFSLQQNGGPTPTIAFATDSPVLNAGSNLSALTVDQRQLIRTALGAIDIGAFERQSRTVVSNTNDGGDGTLRAALLEANRIFGAETITFDAAAFTGTKIITLTTGEIPIADAVTIAGTGADRLTINGLMTSRIFNINVPSTVPGSPTITLNGLTLANGKAANGAAILIQDEKLTLNNCEFRNNTATISDGGAIHVFGGGSLTANATLFTANRANYGGAISFYNLGGSLSLTNSTISNNVGMLEGGAVFFSNNLGSGVTIRNSTIISNSANEGGGLNAPVAGTTVSVISSIVSGNFADSAPDIYSGSNTITLNASAVGSASGFTFTGSGNLPFGSQLKLRSLQLNGGPTRTHAFEPGSPLLDKGIFGALSFDQRGLDRLLGAGTDIGALERQASGFVTNTLDSGEGSLRENVLEANRLAGPDTVRFDSTMFASAKTITLSVGEITVTDTLDVNAADAKGVTLSGNNTNRIFNVSPFIDTSFNKLIFTSGKSTRGAALYGQDESSINLVNCTVSGNSANFGGGILVEGRLTLDNSIVSNNTAGNNNGGVYAFDLVVGNSTIAGNSAAIAVGGAVSTRSLMFENSTIAGNSATFGGGLLVTVTPGPVMPYVVRNSTISGNKATSGTGGGIALGFSASEPFAGTLMVQNSTITANSAALGGGGIARRFGGNLDITSSIVSGNVAVAAADIQSAASVTLNRCAVGAADGFSFMGSNNLRFGAILKLGPLAVNGGTTQTHLPGANSPLVNAGSNPATLTVDQRGLPRTVGSIDIGAVEVQANGVNPVIGYAINGGDPQRSRITGVTLNLSQPVDAAWLAGPGGITFTRTLATSTGFVGTQVKTGATGANGRVLVSQTVGMVTSVDLTFDNANGAAVSNGVEFKSLADGRYQILVGMLNFASPLNDLDLRRLFGDGNGDGTTNGTDFADFGNKFGFSVPINWAFDFDGNLTQDASDFGAFGGRFGLTL